MAQTSANPLPTAAEARAFLEGMKRVSIWIVVDDGIVSPSIPMPLKMESDLLH